MLLKYEGEPLEHMASDDYWDYDLTLLEAETFIPEQAGHSGKVKGGALLVRAFLYSHAEKKVICEGLFQVGTGKSIERRYTTFGTAAEIAEQRAKRSVTNLDARHLAMMVKLDLQRKAYFSAKSHLQVVSERTTKPFPMTARPSGVAGENSGGEPKTEEAQPQPSE